MKKIIAMLLMLVMLFSMVACSVDKSAEQDDDNAQSTDKENTDKENGDGDDSQDEEETDPSKIIDIYLIAGQSNALGCSYIANRGEVYMWSVYAKAGFPNVHYAGNSRGHNEKGVVDRQIEWQTTKLGFGVNSNCIGPELGMAKSLSKYYNEKTGRNAGIIKFAHGGTSIRNTNGGANAYGNWCPPSYANALGVSYDENSYTGGLYRGLLDQVEKNISELEEYGGYTKINLKGMFWMQGEADRYVPTEYEKAFECFVKDVRKDLSEVMLDFTDGKSDCGASELPIFVGTISKTYNLTATNTENSINVPFIKTQKKFAETIENCYVIDNSELPISRWNAETGKTEVLGSDPHHWKLKDMLNIGENVGEAMYKKKSG